MITCLAGGVGAAKFLAGLVQVVPPEEVTAVVNTGDDIVLHGLHISPDLDTVTYTLANAVNPETGWGLRGETWEAMEALDRYSGQTWFRLGDRDLATHMYRTQRLSEGVPLDAVTAEVVLAWGVGLRLLPMSNDRVETRITLRDRPGSSIGFQEWFVAQRHATSVSAVSFDGAAESKPAPGVVEAIDQAEVVVICPSNPVVSIAPILAVPGIADAISARRGSCVAVSPIIAGKALKGPADTLMADLGHASTVAGVARLYARFASVLLIDDADRELTSEIEAEGMRCVVTPTVMSSPERASHLARAAIDAVQ